MRTTRALRSSAVLFALAIVACSSGSGDPGPEGKSGNRSAEITALGAPVVDGCSIGLAFDLTAPAAIGVVGITPLGGLAGAPVLSLYAVDELGNEQLIAEEASQIGSTLASMLSRTFASDTAVAGSDTSILHGTNQNSAVSTADAIRNGTAATSHDSGFYARDSYGDQALLQDSLAAAGWGTEPVASSALPLVSRSVEGSQTVLDGQGGLQTSTYGEDLNGFYATDSLRNFGATLDESNGFANRSVETGIGRLNVRESWGQDTAGSQVFGSDALGAFGAQSVSTQGASGASYTAEQAIADTVAYSSLDSLNRSHFVLRVAAEAVGSAAGLRVFQGTESLLFATEDANIALPGCGL